MAKKEKTPMKKDTSQEEEIQEENAERVQEIEAQAEGEGEVSAEEKEAEALEEELADLSPEELAELKSSLDESEEKAQEYLEGWQRSRAEFANYKKRIMREREEMYERAKGEIIKDYLDISDDLGRALQDRPDSGEGAAWAEGVELIYQKLQLKLEKAGVEPMNAEGEMFDPNLHEAIFKEESEEHESGQIIEVLQKGYMLGDRVLRPAIVRVAA